MGEITIRQSQAENWSFARIKLPGNAPDDNVSTIRQLSRGGST